MNESSQIFGQHHARFEVLPLGRGEEDAAKLPQPVRLTVTCSPRRGPDRSVGVARLICDHWQRPREIGIAGYPEGHPTVDSNGLADALEQKSALASYITTQLCFDEEAVLAWLRETRQRGVRLPVLVGLPGVVDRRRLLELSVRIGVGPSLAFLRKHRGLRSLLGHSTVRADRVYEVVAPSRCRELNIRGFHYYTFNQLLDTWRWERQKRDSWPLAAESRCSALCEEVVTT
jgi:5,10-methylenetetrahydrofolate reductase